MLSEVLACYPISSIGFNVREEGAGEEVFEEEAVLQYVVRDDVRVVHH